MALKDAVRNKICRIRDTSDLSLHPFIRWAGMLDKQLLLQVLNDLQIELDEELQFYEQNSRANTQWSVVALPDV